MKKLNRWLVNDSTAYAYKDGYNQGRADAIEEVNKYIRLKRKYAERSVDDYLNYIELENWLDDKLKDIKK